MLISTQIVHLPEMIMNNQMPKIFNRPLGNLYSPSNIKENGNQCNYNQNKRYSNSKVNDNINLKEISQGDRKRPKLGSVPSKEYLINYKNIYERNRLSSIRSLHQIKIERGLTLSFIENVTKK